jgi:formylglycine-generating enzyme required for sulfatase activity
LEKVGAKNLDDGFWHDRKWKCPNAPVVGVSWFETAAFCNWLTEIRNDGYLYRLPTEEEWQAVAAGKEGREYPWGKGGDSKKCNTSEIKIGRTSSVGIFVDGNTPEGVADMSGNIWEWMKTEYKTKSNQDDFKFDLEVYNLYLKGKYGEAWDLSEKRENAPGLHGGSWSHAYVVARCAFLFYSSPDYRFLNIGFRCVRSKKG